MTDDKAAPAAAAAQQPPASGPAPDGPAAGGPSPEPIRFYGTTWVDHSGSYALRRTGLALGALLAAAAGAVVLRMAYQGLTVAEVGDWANVLVVVAFALCSALAFSRTLTGFTRRPDAGEPAGPDSSMRSIRVIGFIGVLLAYAVRSVVEAPGEKLHRAEYEEALARHERRRAARTRNPAGRSRNRPAPGKGAKRRR